MSLRERVYHFIEPDYEPGRIVDVAIIVLILLNIVAPDPRNRRAYLQSQSRRF